MKLKWLLFALMLAFMTVGIAATAYAQGGDVSRGAKLFSQNCAVCHGERGQGRVGATLAKDFPGIRVDALLKEIITNGVSGSVMPAWAKSKGGPLSDSEIDDLVTFIRSLGNVAPTLLPRTVAPATQAIAPSPVATFPPGDATRGAKVYADNCIVCHGERGEGRIGASLQKDWPGINVNALLDTTIARGVAGSKMPAWAKTDGGPLTNQEIADAAAYVRTLKPLAAPVATVAPDASPSSVLGNSIGLVCFGLIVLAGSIVLGIGLVGARARQ